MKTIEAKMLFIALLLSTAVPLLPAEGELYIPVGGLRLTYLREERVRPRLIQANLHKAAKGGDVDVVKKALAAGY